MDVQIKDRDKEVEYLRMSCNMAELGIDYTQADLIIRVQKSLSELGDNFSVKDASKIMVEHREYWKNYFENLEKEKK